MALAKATAVDDTPKRILNAAIRLFARKSFDGTSTKEICDEARVNSAAIHYHFESKEGLLRKIIEDFGKSRLDATRATLQPPHSAEEVRVRLQIYLQEVSDVIAQEPERVQIIQREAQLLHRRSEDIFHNVFHSMFLTMVEFLTQARKRKLIAADVDPLFAATMLFSQISNLTEWDRIARERAEIAVIHADFRSKWVKETLRIFLGGIIRKDQFFKE